MRKQQRKSALQQQKALSIVLAMVNGVQVNAATLLPLAGAVPEKEPYIMANLVESGGEVVDSLIFSTVHAAFTAEVSGSEAQVSGETVNGGTQKIHDGGSATSTTVQSGGTQSVDHGTTKDTLLRGGTQLVSNGGQASGTVIGNVYSFSGHTVSAGGYQAIESGGQAIHTMIYKGGSQTIYDCGSVRSTTIAGGTQVISGGGIATSTEVDLGGTQIVCSGGNAKSTIVSNGKQQVRGGAVENTTISYGNQVVYSSGQAINTTLLSGGQQSVYGDGIAMGTTIHSGSQQYVYTSGSALNTLLSGGQQIVYSCGVATNTLISAGGRQKVYISGDAVSTAIFAGGYQEVGSDGKVTSTIINSGGTQTISSGGTATSTTINRSGLQNVSSGGRAVSTTISAGGTQHVYSGGSAEGITIYPCGIQTVDSGGCATGIQNAGSQTVDPGGSDTSSTINSGATQTASSGGKATGTIISGTQIISGQADSSTVVSGGTQTITSGGTASNTLVQSGGDQNVSQGGSAIDTKLEGGTMTLASGGIASGTRVSSGGVIYLADGAVLGGTTTLTQAELALTGSAGTYTVTDLMVDQGSLIQLAHGQTVGNHLTIGKLTGNAAFIINTNLAKGQSDRITIQSANGTNVNTVQVAYDPGFASGKTVTGSAIFADAPSSQTKFTAVATDVGAYRYTPSLSVNNAGTTWSINALVSNQDSSGQPSTPQPAPTPVNPSETLYTASDMGIGSLVLWRAATNSLEKRLGELRGSQGKQGIWTRIYRGAQELKDNEARSLTQTYTAIQGGYDTKHTVKAGDWYSGYAVGYLSSDITLARGSGKASNSSLSLYGSWLGRKGHYLDIIVKGGKERNNYDSYLQNLANTKVSGSSAAWTSSLSVEYGYRKKLPNQWYMEPQTEWTLGRIGRASYVTSDQTNVQNGVLHSLVGRLGLALGRQTAQSSFYGKVSVLREFQAGSRITMSNGILRPVTLEQNLKGTWLEFIIGFTNRFNRETSSYIEIEKATGDKTKTPWLINMGIRHSF